MRTVMRVLAVAVILSLPVFYSSCGDGGGGGTGPDQPPAETLASFELTVPDSIAEGESFSLTVTAVGNRGTKPLTSYSGTVSLSTTLGGVTPSSLAVTNGTGAAQVTLSSPGQQTLSASGGGRTGSAAVDVTDLPDPTIPGDPQATLEEAVPDSIFLPNPADYSNDHPGFPGPFLSKTTVLLAFEVGTTVQEANDLLVPLGGKLVGGIQGVPGQVPSIVMVELATTSHQEMETALTSLQADPNTLAAVQDALLETKTVPGDNGGDPSDWTWDPAPAGGNWGLELLRVPQMWNLNRALEKAQALSWTGVLDLGFNDGHEDFEDGRPVINLSPAASSDHGTGVAGIIAASFDNDIGIDGVNPFTGLVVKAPSWNAATGPSGSGSYAQALTNLASMMYLYPEMRVVNISLGFEAPGDANTDLAWQQAISQDGLLFATTLQSVGANQVLPLFLVATGNESNLGFGLQQGKWQSPFCNAAIEHGADTVLCIEDVGYDLSSPGDAMRSAESNIGGHLSAPGVGIRSTAGAPDQYGLFPYGTSYSTPHVTGLVGFMLAADPTLTYSQIRDALFSTSVPVGGFAANRIDAWAAVMEIDRVQGNERILRMMLDIDDGTPDGNQRVRYDTITFPDYDSLDVDMDGGLGDGTVDMSDFRVWRDWYLKIWHGGSAVFDGREDHPKMDVNDSGKTDLGGLESLYPRGDFNGDGMITVEDSAYVPGAVQDTVSDLDVLKVVFNDPDYAAEDLDTLVLSVDIRVDASTVFDLMGAPSVQVWILDGGGPPPPAYYPTIQSRTIFPDDPEQVFTLRHVPTGYRVEIDVGPTLSFGTDAEQVGKELGGDISVRPIYGTRLSPKATYTSTCDDPGAQDAAPIVLADWGIEPGDIVVLDQEGFYSLWEGGGQSEEVQAVFSASGGMTKEVIDLPGDNEGDPPKKFVLRTVTDAIEAGNNVYTPPPYECEGQVADIPQDFSITPHAVFEVPEGATHLFIAPRDIYYGDNQQVPDDPLEVSISAIYAPEWEQRINRASGGR